MPLGTVLFVLTIAAAIVRLVVLFTNGAGPNSMWSLGKNDPIRNALFRQDGSWRRFSKLGLVVAIVLLVVIGSVGIL